MCARCGTGVDFATDPTHWTSILQASSQFRTEYLLGVELVLGSGTQNLAADTGNHCGNINAFTDFERPGGQLRDHQQRWVARDTATAESSAATRQFLYLLVHPWILAQRPLHVGSGRTGRLRAGSKQHVSPSENGWSNRKVTNRAQAGVSTRLEQGALNQFWSTK